MAITITVENGTNVAQANSWLSVADARTYALNRGIDLTTGTPDDTVAAWLIRAADWLNGKRDAYKGIKTFPTGTMQWPRTGAYIDPPALWDANSIPPELIAAQAQLVIALKAGIPLDSPVIGGVLPIIREKVDVLETEYATPAMLGAMGGVDWASDSMPAVDALLAPLLDDVSGFRVYRV